MQPISINILICFQSSVVEHAGIGVQLLWQLVSEMNQLSESDATLTLTKHRKIASSFRDVHLYEIFQLSCTLLRNTLENFRNMNFEDQGQVGDCFKQNKSLALNILLLAQLIESTVAPGAQLPHIRLYWDVH